MTLDVFNSMTVTAQGLRPGLTAAVSLTRSLTVSECRPRPAAAAAAPGPGARGTVAARADPRDCLPVPVIPKFARYSDSASDLRPPPGPWPPGTGRPGPMNRDLNLTSLLNRDKLLI
jgi:hypothetical protein